MSLIRLYHFTTKAFAQTIKSQGFLPKPLAIPGGRNSSVDVVSLTSKGNPKNLIGKSLTDGSPLTGISLQSFLAQNPHVPKNSIIPTLNTCEVRIRVDIPASDTNLLLFSVQNAKSLGFNPQQLKHFFHLGGGQPGEWWIYCGILPATYIVAANENRPAYDIPI